MENTVCVLHRGVHFSTRPLTWN